MNYHLYLGILCSLIALWPSRTSATPEPQTVEEQAWSHIIVMDHLGDAKRPHVLQNGKVKLESFSTDDDHADYKKYVHGIVTQIAQSKMQRVLIFIHGGMNVNSQAAARAVRLLQTREIEDSGYYPLFICWDSPFYGDWEQVLWVRAGKTERFGRGRFYAIVTAPFQILADVGRAITRLPAQICAFGYNDLYSMRPDGFTEHSVMTEEYEKLKSVHFPPPKVGAQLGVDSRTFDDKVSRNVSAVVTAPVRVATHAVIDAIGVGAWNNMLRRTDTMFERVPRYGKEKTPVEQRLSGKPTGALSIFFDEMTNALKERNPKSITIVAHSMGAIISNRIIQKYGTLEYENVVYMAAACRVADFEGAVLPYMSSPLGTKAQTTFHNLSLNPVCETGEIFGKMPFDFVPRGSLLVWIDNIFGNPPSEQRRMLGIYQTALLASHNIPDPLRNRVFYKAFGAVSGKAKYENGRDGPIQFPQKHGDFSNARFWKSEFWKLDSNASKTAAN